MSAKKYTVAQHGDQIRRFLDMVRDSLGLYINYELTDQDVPHPDFENPDIIVRFSGEDVDLLLANKAEFLLALEQLTSEMLHMGVDEHTRLCFDANDYRVMRVEELRLSALTAAEKVKKTRIPFQFNPMNSRERRILHLALRDEKQVRSESAGLAPNRSVVIYPADMPSSPGGFKPPAPFGRRRRR